MNGASDFGSEYGAEKTMKGGNRQCLSMVDCDSRHLGDVWALKTEGLQSVSVS